MKFHPVLRAASLLAPIMFCAQAGATNGYFSHGIGTHNKAQAGAGSASPTMSIDIANNPAAAALVDPRWDVGLSIFSPRRSYETGPSDLNGQNFSFTIGPNDLDSENEWFPIPYAAKVWKLDNDQALGFAFYGRGGMNTEWRGGTATGFNLATGSIDTLPGTFASGTAGVDLMQAFVELAWAGSIGDFHWGITPMLAIQAFEARGVGYLAPFTETFAKNSGAKPVDNLSNNGHEYSWGYGLKLGGIWQVTETVSLALSYQTELEMTEFDDYADLFPEQGDFDIPAFTRAGISWRPSDNLGLHFDVEHTQFSEVDSVGNSLVASVLQGCPFAGITGDPTNVCLGGDKGPGFGWDDMTIYKLGVNWNMQSLPGYTFRAGYSYGEQPIPSSEMTFNILAPAVMEDHFSFGVNRERSNGHEISMALLYAPEQTIKGPNNFDPTQQVELSMSQFEIEFAYSW
jgi:long-chain fatty acid transport protein